MSFWEKAMEIFEYGADKLRDLSGDITKEMERYDRYSDDDLIKILKRTSDIKKRMAIMKLLKERGY